MRGKLQNPQDNLPLPGLIPAHAGKTPEPEVPALHGAAHPRACGENRIQFRHPHRLPGSSPRMRGKLLAALPDLCLSGLIPAHAGKTVHEGMEHQTGRAHPRACGENRFGVSIA